MIVKIKKLHENAVIPAYAKPGDAGLDLTATSVVTDEYGNVVYGTGLAIEIPYGYAGLLFPRSSNSKVDLYLTNHVGVVDSGYRGEIMFKYRPIDGLVESKIYQVGDRVGQIVILPYPSVSFEEVEQLSTTERGEGGYGSTGK
jgi:dUTP pyrophosphatase